MADEANQATATEQPPFPEERNEGGGAVEPTETPNVDTSPTDAIISTDPETQPPQPEKPFPDRPTILRTQHVAHGGYLRINDDKSVTWRPSSYVGPDLNAPSVDALIGMLP